MMTMSTTEMVLDRRVLQQLATEVASETVAARFAAQYLDLLHGRVSRIQWAFAAGLIEDARDAILSLKVTSATVGARQLEFLAQSIEDDLVDQDGKTIGTAKELRLVADRTAEELRLFISETC